MAYHMYPLLLAILGENGREKRPRVQRVHLQYSPAGPPLGSGYIRPGNWLCFLDHAISENMSFFERGVLLS